MRLKQQSRILDGENEERNHEDAKGRKHEKRRRKGKKSKGNKEISDVARIPA